MSSISTNARARRYDDYALHRQYTKTSRKQCSPYRTQYSIHSCNAHREADLNAVVRVHQWITTSTTTATTTTSTIATTPARHTTAATTIMIQKAVIRAVDDRYRGPPASTASGGTSPGGSRGGGARGMLWRAPYYTHGIVLRGDSSSECSVNRVCMCMSMCLHDAQ